MTSERAYWHEDAACRTADPEELFADSTGQNRAKAICTGCPVRTECLAEALDNRIEWGVGAECDRKGAQSTAAPQAPRRLLEAGPGEGPARA